MSVSRKCLATTEVVARVPSDPGAVRLVVGEVACQLVLEPELLFLEAVEKVFVGVGSVLFLFDERVKRGVLRFEFLDDSPVHRCHSFRLSQCHHHVINHFSGPVS